MNKKRLAVVSVFLVLVILLIVVIVNAVNNNKPKKDDNIKNETVDKNNNDNNQNKEEVFEESKDNNDIKGNENTNVIDKDTAVNTSNKLKGVKKIANLEISNISVKYSLSETKITGVISNKTNNDIDADFVTMDILGNDGKVIESNKIYLGKVKASSTKNLDFTTTANIVNLSDIVFKK